MSPSDALSQALSAFDNSPTKLAAALGGTVKRQHVEHWVKVGRAPAEHCPLIERATSGAVTCEQLRPDIEWSVLRASQPA